MSYTVAYSKSDEDNAGSIEFEYDSMTEVISIMENTFGVKFTKETLIGFLSGVTIQAMDLDLWLQEN